MRLSELSIKRWGILIVAAFVLLLVSVRLHLKWKVHQAVGKLGKSGQALRKADLFNKYSGVSVEENAVVLLAEARKKLTYPTDDDRERTPVLGDYYESSNNQGRWPDEVLATVKAYLSIQEEGMDMARRGVQRSGYSAQGVGADRGGKIISLGDVKLIVSLFSLQLRYCNQTENWEAIPPLIEVQLRIANLMEHEPSLMSQLVRIAFYAIALSDLERYLNASGEHVGDLSEVSELLKIATVDWPLGQTIEWERVEALEPIYWKSTQLQLTYDFDFETLLTGSQPDQWEQALERLKVVLYRFSGMSDLDLLYLLDGFERMEMVSEESLLAIANLSTNWSSVLPKSNGHQYYFWSDMILPIWGGALEKIVTMQARIRAAYAAVGVTLYRKEHIGKPPGSLDELVPEYLTEVPIEPQTGQPYELAETAHGYAIGRGAPVFSVVVSEP